MRGHGLALTLAVIASSLVSAHDQRVLSQIRGRVTDTKGFAMPGATVVVRPTSGGPLLRAESPRDGRYQFDVEAGLFDVVTAEDGFDAVRVIEAGVKSMPLEIDLPLSIGMRLECITVPKPPYGTIEGTVTDPKGVGLPFAVVRVRQISGTPVSGNYRMDAFGYADGDGHYSATAPAGDHEVSATYPGYIARPQLISVSVGKKSQLDLSGLLGGKRTPGMETLHSFTNCGELGFKHPAPRPR